MRRLAFVLIALGFLLIGAAPSLAAGQEKVVLCHAAGLDGTTQYVTIEVAYPAAFGQAGHFYENGTPRAGHENDYLGACVVDTTTTTAPSTSTTTTEAPTTTSTVAPTTTTSVQQDPTTTTTEAPVESTTTTVPRLESTTTSTPDAVVTIPPAPSTSSTSLGAPGEPVALGGPAELPRTGADAKAFLAWGLVLIIVGLAFLLTRKPVR